MDKRTRAAKEAELKALQDELAGADADDDVEVWVKDEKGRQTQLRGGHAKKWLKNLGLDDDDDQGDGTDPEGPDDDDTDPEPPKTKMRDRFFAPAGTTPKAS